MPCIRTVTALFTCLVLLVIHHSGTPHRTGIDFMYPNGHRKALIMSYDDGLIQDKKLIALFNKHGIAGTLFSHPIPHAF